MVDQDGYRRLTLATGLGTLPPGLPGSRAAHGVLPAVVFPALERVFGSSVASVEAQGAMLRVRAVASVPVTPVAPGSDFVIVSSTAFGQALAAAPAALRAPNVELVTGPGASGTRPAAVARRDGVTARVSSRSAVRAGYGTPLESGALRVYLALALAGAGYAAPALLLAMLGEAADRTAVLTRLRVMGLTRRQARGLVSLENLPRLVAALAGGALTAAAAITLTAPAVNLGVLAFGTGDRGAPVPVPALAPDAVALAGCAAVPLVVTGAVTAGQVWWATRRRESTELRVGDGG